MAGTAGIRYRTLFQKREFSVAPHRDWCRHLSGELFRIRCCRLEGRWENPPGPESPICMRITPSSLWMSAWCSTIWKRESCCIKHADIKRNERVLFLRENFFLEKSYFLISMLTNTNNDQFYKGQTVYQSNSSLIVFSNFTCQTNPSVSEYWGPAGCWSGSSDPDGGVRMNISLLLCCMEDSTSSRRSMMDGTGQVCNRAARM